MKSQELFTPNTQKITQGNSGGPRAGSKSQVIFAHFLQFSPIFDPVAGTSRFSELFGALPQKRLDKPRASAYNWRAAGSFFHFTFALAQETS